MLQIPPATILIPMATPEQVVSAVQAVARKLRDSGIPVEVRRSQQPAFLVSGVRNVDGRVVLTRLDVYISQQDYANALPMEEAVIDGVVYRTGAMHVVSGVAVEYRYEKEGETYRVVGAVVHLIGRYSSQELQI